MISLFLNSCFSLIKIKNCFIDRYKFFERFISWKWLMKIIYKLFTNICLHFYQYSKLIYFKNCHSDTKTASSHRGGTSVMYEKVERFETESEAPSSAHHSLGNNDSHLRVSSLWIPILVSLLTLIIFFSIRLVATSSGTNSEKLIPGNMSQEGLDFLHQFMPESLSREQV